MGGSDGSYPYAGVLLSGGDLYGTTTGAATSGLGTVFKLTPGNPWIETILHSFAGSPTDGAFPDANLIIDKTGALYGTTQNGGTTGAQGTVFKIVP
jgi:uncharacterized repeat protein (TIGR03803 family)